MFPQTDGAGTINLPKLQAAIDEAFAAIGPNIPVAEPPKHVLPDPFALLGQYQAQNGKNLRTVFDEFDADNSGALDRGEIRKLLLKLIPGVRICRGVEWNLPCSWAGAFELPADRRRDIFFLPLASMLVLPSSPHLACFSAADDAPPDPVLPGHDGRGADQCHQLCGPRQRD